MTSQVEWQPDGRSHPLQSDHASRLQIPLYEFRILGRQRLLDLLDRAVQRRMTLLCAPAGAGKTVTCASWAAARTHMRHVVWVALQSENDQAWFWAYVCSGLRQTSAIPEEAAQLLEDGPIPAFPLRLAGMAWRFSKPVVIVLDNMDFVTDGELLSGLELLARHAPHGLRLVMCARQRPRMRLDRLRASGDLTEISTAGLAAARAAVSQTQVSQPRSRSRLGGRERLRGA